MTMQLLAMVYSNFAQEEKKKFRQLFLHKIEALNRAYSVLATPNGIEFEDFLRFMQYYKPQTRMIIIIYHCKQRVVVLSSRCSCYLCCNIMTSGCINHL